MDVAGSALRLGSEAMVVALEGRDVMPAPPDEVQDALDEGAVLRDGAMVKTIEEASGALLLRCVQVDLDPAAPAGVIRPLEVSGTDFAFEADTVILAVGQDPELADWEGLLAVTQGMVVVDDRYETSCPAVFAAGDVASAERFVSVAIGDGKRAAESIARFLGHKEKGSEEAAGEPAEVTFADINTFYFPPSGRGERGKVAAELRKTDFREITIGFAADQAQAQAERCFSCGTCIECDNCFYFCPDMAIAKDSSSPLHYRVLDQYCKGCGCCLEECPRGAVGVREETK